MVNIHSCFVFGAIFIGSLSNSLYYFTFFPSWSLDINPLANNIYKIARNHTNIYNSWFLKQKKDGRNEKWLNTMNSIETNPSC